ncbi:MAG: ArsR/SmtB family transcription factor [Solirubrobacteraceae bacterium]
MTDSCELLCIDMEKAEGLRRARLEQAAAESVAALAAALGDPTRIALARALADGGELCVCDLSWIVERSEKLVSHHLRKMRTAGVARSRRDGKMVMYEITAAGRALLDVLLPAGEVHA